MNYNKQDTTMTKGFAILCMIMLHLFCRQGKEVFGPIHIMEYKVYFMGR